MPPSKSVSDAVEDECRRSRGPGAGEDGAAVLTGAVDSWSERSAATENAWEGGAGWVANELRIDGAS